MRLRRWLFRRGRAVINRLPDWAPPLYSAVWMHLLDARDLDQITLSSYATDFGAGFDTAHHNQNGLWPWEEAAFARHIAPASRILVAGAGGGREMIWLARMGHDVVGFDASEDLVEACRVNLAQAGVSARVEWVPAGQVPMPSRTFDAVIVGRGVYHHIARRARRIAFLTALSAHLKPDAPLLLGEFLTRDDAPAKGASGIVERGDFVASAFFHHFTQVEIERELGEAGLSLVDYDAIPPDQGKLAYAMARRA